MLKYVVRIHNEREDKWIKNIEMYQSLLQILSQHDPTHVTIMYIIVNSISCDRYHWPAFGNQSQYCQAPASRLQT